MNANFDLSSTGLIAKVLKRFAVKDLNEINISLCLEDLNSNTKIISYSLNPEDQTYYAASMIKLFAAFLAKYKLQQNLKELIKVRTPDEKDFGTRSTIDDVYDAISESLKVSDNDALGFLVDFITDTNSGTRLSSNEYEIFKAKREVMEEFFKARSYSSTLRLRNKCFSFAPYGRDRQLVFEESNQIMSNRLTITDLSKIIRDIKLNYPDLLEYMKRDISNPEDEQVKFIAAGLLPFKKKIKEYYSKAGWTSKVRHDAALIKFNKDKEYLFTIMTKGLSKHEALIPEITHMVFAKVVL